MSAFFSGFFPLTYTDLLGTSVQEVDIPTRVPNVNSANSFEVATDAYVVVGVATCFVKEEGKLQALKVMEPIPSATLQTLCQGIPTSYEIAIATTFDAVWRNGQPIIPDGFPPDTQIGFDFENRLLATARSYRSKPEAQALIPVGQSKTDLQYSTERKRLLNANRIVRVEDNVKQHAYTHQVL
jgi:hypothetical protein